MDKIVENFLAPLSSEIKKSYNTLIFLLKNINEDQRTKKILKHTKQTVNLADIIAYQIGWGKLLISWYQAGIQEKKPQMPGEGFTTWDYAGLAEHFYKKYHYDKATQQLEVFYIVVKTVISIVEKEYQTGNLDKLGTWDWCTLKSGKKWPLSKWIQINTVAPYKRAIRLLKKEFV